jgi:uncharacterized protein (TIGR03437 family)
MCRRNTPRRRCVPPGLAFLALALGATLAAQSLKFDWRRIGNTALDLSLAGVATGSVERVWYSPDGSRLFARTGTGRVFATSDFETWTEAGATEAPASVDLLAFRLPEASSRVRGEVAPGARLYAFGRFVYRSDDAGTSWSNLTGFKNSSLIGEGLSDLAISPKNVEEIVAAASTGVWRSVDGGLSWTGLNDAMPNLRSRRILALPSGVRGMRIAVDTAGALSAWEWNPGEKQAWRPYDGADLKLEEDLKQALGSVLKSRITAVSVSGDYVYLGSAAGQLWASADRGRTWTKAPDSYAAPVERIWLDARDPRLALAAMGAPLSNAAPNAKTARVLRTINGGGFWDDLTSDLPDGAVHGIAADRSTGAIYAGTGRGLYMTYGDLIAAGPATPWTSITDGLPPAPVQDVALDPAGNQLYAAFDGYGIYAAAAPHRSRDPRVVSAADFSSRPAAPGALLSVLGANLRTARAGNLRAPVLASADGKTEIQVPFEASGANLALSFEGAAGMTAMGLALRPTSPGIFVDRDGTPMLLDGDSGVLLDAMTPARSNGRIQILATGLGRVRPEWPAGTPAPADNTPRVVAQVRAYLDREPVEVTRAILAPGYVGFYLVEIQMPKIVNYGPAELYIETDGQGSNRVRLYIEP